jgi:hypothetical protein
MRGLWSSALTPLACACATRCPAREIKVEPVSQTVEVPVQVRCKIDLPARPSYALDDPSLKDRSFFDKATAALVEVEQRRAYEERLEAALKACADAKVD